MAWAFAIALAIPGAIVAIAIVPMRWIAIPVVGTPVLWATLVTLGKSTYTQWRLGRRKSRARPLVLDPPREASAGSEVPLPPSLPRQPVVYLRSFDDDQTAARLSGGRTEEEHLAAMLYHIGPFIAVGRPGEVLPEVGAKRLYANDSEWQGVVEQLIGSARLVVIRTGATTGLHWEIERAVQILAPERLLLVVDDRRELVEVLARIRSVHPSLSAPLSFGRRSVGSIIGFVAFDESWNAVPLPIRGRGIYRQMHDSYLGTRLFCSLRPIFQRLGVPWRAPAISFRSLRIGQMVVMLACVPFIAMVGPSCGLGDTGVLVLPCACVLILQVASSIIVRRARAPRADQTFKPPRDPGQ